MRIPKSLKVFFGSDGKMVKSEKGTYYAASRANLGAVHKAGRKPIRNVIIASAPMVTFGFAVFLVYRRIRAVVSSIPTPSREMPRDAELGETRALLKNRDLETVV
jgi:hypothetical protein|tara:strand:+ start:266 stop:580 length:315 start_codon:yes stop_codon:yes gene_type:complete